LFEHAPEERIVLFPRGKIAAPTKHSRLVHRSFHPVMPLLGIFVLIASSMSSARASAPGPRAGRGVILPTAPSRPKNASSPATDRPPHVDVGPVVSPHRS
jgi:hypothetical protein